MCLYFIVHLFSLITQLLSSSVAVQPVDYHGTPCVLSANVMVTSLRSATGIIHFSFFHLYVGIGDLFQDSSASA